MQLVASNLRNRINEPPPSYDDIDMCAGFVTSTSMLVSSSVAYTGRHSVCIEASQAWVRAMKPERSPVERPDRLKSIVCTLLADDDQDLDVAKFTRRLGYDTKTTAGKSATQAIRRWTEGRWESVDGRLPDAPGLPPLKRAYRLRVFMYVRREHKDEYLKPLPPGEVWPNAEERERWHYDTRKWRVERRDPALLDGFVAYLRSGATITQVTKDFTRAELDSASGESESREYGPAGGLTEEDYRRLAEVGDHIEDTLDDLAWAVVSNLLWKKGLLRSQIRRARRLCEETDAIRDRVDAASFEEVTDSLYDEVTRRG